MLHSNNQKGTGRLDMNGRLLAVLFTAMMTGSALATPVDDGNDFRLASESVYATEYGPTLPPVGFVNFCARNAAECTPLGGRTAILELTPERFNLLHQVNAYVNAKVAPVSDLDLYSRPEYWTYPVDAGDCEDYVLLKKRYLEGFGFPAETLLIAVVLDEAGDGHAVLMVRTSAGDYILDNRRPEILRWNETRYQFLKRQSQSDPRAWTALTSKSMRGKGAIAGGN
jgi:predicted transglutaminase-like cysteine proteinase